jgi:RHS repeat-associated protein
MKNEVGHWGIDRGLSEWGEVEGVYTFGQMRYLTGNGNTEDGLYFYHGNHLSSTQVITDVHANISQAVLYTPWGSVIKEYKADWMLDTIPRYLFNAKELDEESGMYYCEVRYYAPPTFISRDPLIDSFPNWTPYHYCFNNPIKYIDPTGMSPGDKTSPKLEFYMEIKVSFGPQIGGSIKIFNAGVDLKAQGPSVEGSTRFALSYHNGKWSAEADQSSKNIDYNLSAGIGNLIGIDKIAEYGIMDHPVFKETITTLRQGVTQEITRINGEGEKTTQEKPLVLESSFSINAVLIGIEVTVGVQGYEEY